MGNVILNKGGTAEASIAAYRIVKPGTSDGNYLQAAAATDFLVGVCESVGPAIGERVDVIKSGIADVEFGGTVTRGGPVTADASGKAVAAAPGAGSNVRIIGFAEVSAVSGDIAPVLIAPGVMQG
jgi:Uncharacterized conserved protein (DUF2190)